MQEKTFEERVTDINNSIDGLEVWFNSEGFQQSKFFSLDEKKAMHAAIQRLQKELKEEVGRRVGGQGTQPLENQEFSDLSDIERIVKETKFLIVGVIEPLSRGKDHLKGEPLPTSEEEVKKFAKEIKARVDVYKNDALDLTLGKKFVAAISKVVNTLVSGVLGLLSRNVGAELDETAKQERFPIKKAVGSLAKSVVVPHPFTQSESAVTPQLVVTPESVKPIENIFIIGPEKSGKTALFKGLAKPNEAFTQNYERTLGMDYAHTSLTSDKNDKKGITAMGGSVKSEQELPDSTKKWMKQADVIFITLDAKTWESADQAKETLIKYKNLAQTVAPQASIQLVITKMDSIDEKDREAFKKKVNDIAKEVGVNDSVKYTSAKDKNIGVTEVKEIISPEKQEASSITPRR